ncbi:MAG: hypothetical protein JHC81_04805 [Brevundimonas sp.]|uniref:hypothetical protein n=1 Tax=Brevundimonas sp. TaxID=1871086 RepID=UPI001A3191B2|nr:hypothetical protein [Brevundimonas sp.]MBJ7446834.1 hypothetical protein [Brevundimonas sp.]
MNAPANAMAVMAHRVTPQADDVDFFPTQPWGGRAGAEIIKQVLDPSAAMAWECACGPGHMVHALRDYFPAVVASDAYLYDGNRIYDFTSDAPPPFEADWIVTNPPFSNIEAFITLACQRARRGVAMLLPARCLEGVGRHGLLYGSAQLTVVAPFSERLPMHKGVYDADRSTAAFYAWFFFLKPVLRPRRFMARIGGDYRPGVLPIAPGTKTRLFRTSDLKFAAGGQAREVLARLRANGDTLSGGHLDVLEAVAMDAGARGVTPHPVTYPAGLLASLRMFGLLEHAPELKGDFGDRRFRLADDGRALLIAVGRL